MNESKRQDVLERDDFTCQFCGMGNEEHKEQFSHGIEVHHVVPRKADGSDKKENLLTVCRSCHSTLEKTQGNLLKRLHDNQIDEKVNELENEIERLKEKLEESYTFDELIDASEKFTSSTEVYIFKEKTLFGSNPGPLITTKYDRVIDELNECNSGELKKSSISVNVQSVLKDVESSLAKKIDRRR